MSEKIKSEGTCYVCGKILNKTAMKNHLLKDHSIGDEDCFLIKAECPWDKNYWIYFDVPQNKSMSAIDTFLRNIWLECCGHLSEFDNVGKNQKIAELSKGFFCEHDYDMGSTTTTKVTILDEIKRPKQAKPRLLARNLPPILSCCVCNEPAEIICMECVWDNEDELYCENCYNEHEHDDIAMSVVNSPRMGECGYDGELDKFTDPEEWIEKNQKLLAKYFKVNA
ncbi:MAG: hypothetical protein FWE68_01440 [Defluviitaleaceae bacterium]|nr:hypothetical protein [Defluviitaleaceae bacterium]